MEPKKIAIRGARWLAPIVSVILISGLAGFALLQTPWGRTQAAHLLERALSRGEQQVQLGKVSGLLPFHVVLGRATIKDKDGTWLLLEDVSMRWAPLSLIRGRVHLSELSARHLTVERMPRGEDRRDSGQIFPMKRLASLRWVRVDHLAVEQLDVAESVAGERIVLTMEGCFMRPSAENTYQSELRLEAAQHQNARVFISVRYGSGIGEAHVDAQVGGAAGDILAKILGIPGPLNLTLRGEGPLEDWSGNLKLRADPLGQLDADVAVQVTDKLNLRSKGRAHMLTGQVPEPLRPWLSREIAFALKGWWKPEEHLSVDSLEISTTDASLCVSGSVDLEKQVLQARLTGEFGDLEPISTLTGFELNGSGTLECDVKGPVRQPLGIISLTTGPVQAGPLTAQSIETRLHIGLLERWQDSFPGIRLSSDGMTSGLRFPRLDLEGSPIRWVLVGEAPADGSLHVQRFTLEGKELALETQGVVHIKTPGGSFQGSAEVRDLRAYAPLIGFELPARTTLAFHLNADPEKPLKVRFQGELQVMDPKHASSALLGPQTAYSGSISFSKDHLLLIPELKIRSDNLSLAADGRMDFSRDTVSALWRLQVPDLGSIPYLSAKKLTGPAQANGKLQKIGNEFSIQAQIESRGLDVRGIGLETVTGTLESKGQGLRQQRGRLEMTLLRAAHAFDAEAQFSLDDHSLRLSPVLLKGPETHVNGAVTVDLRVGRTHGDFKGRFGDLSQLSANTGCEVGGKLEVTGEFDISATGEKLKWMFLGQDISAPYGKAGMVQASGDLTRLSQKIAGNMELEGKRVRFGDVFLDTCHLHTRTQKQTPDIAFAADAEGNYHKPFEISTNGVLSFSASTSRIHFLQLRGQYGTYPIELASPSLLEIRDSAIILEQTSVTMGKGVLSASLNVDNRILQLEASLDKLPLEILPQMQSQGVKGLTSGTIRLMGSTLSPRGRMDVEITNLEWGEQGLQKITPSDLRAEARFGEDNLGLQVYLDGLAAQPFRVHLNLPMQFSFIPFRWTFSPDGYLDGDINGLLDLSRIPLILELENQSLTGQAQVNLSVSGTVKSPEVSGLVELENGAYENNQTGTTLKEINIKIRADGGKFYLERAQASEGEDGAIHAQGWISQDIFGGLPFQISFTLKNAALLRHEYAFIQADGDLSWSGNAAKSTLEGTLKTEYAEFRVPNRLPPEIAELEVREINLEGEEPVREEPKKSLHGQHIKLGLQVASSGQIFLRGRGIESEWAGDVLIQGTVAEPMITGSLSTVRGHINLLGKQFSLVRGLLRFAGKTPPNPQIDVLGEAKTKEIIARVALSGDLKSPSVEISSDPPLPSDEVLSHLLFGKGITTLSVAQALQLASAVNTLTRGGSVDVVGRTRDILGLDQLTLTGEGQSAEDAELLAGKYLTEKIYLEVERGITPLSGKVSLEIQLTPNISAVTEIWENSAGGIGLNWKWDY